MIRHDILFYIWLAQGFPFGHSLPSKILKYYGKDIYKFYENVELEAKNFNITKKRIEKLKSKKLTDYCYILDICEKLKIKILCYLDSEYPERLKEIKNPPIVLYYIGNLNSFCRPCIGVVGTRHCNQAGAEACEKLTENLVEFGITTVSGFSRGIDTITHKKTLKESGKTIAVLGTSLEVPYPLKNKELKKNIVEYGGLIISEYPPKTETTNWLFPIRNRIISGMSDGIVVVQAPEKSGALITAKIAMEYEKPIFCVPPMNIFDELNGGNIKCIKNGAKILLDIKEILDVYKNSKYVPKEKKVKEKTKEKNIPENFKKLYCLINKEKRLDEILTKSEYPPNKTLIMLTRMELENIIERTKTGYKRC